MKKSLCLVLALLFLATIILTSCGEKGPADNKTTTDAPSNTLSDSTTAPDDKPDLPATSLDREFTILTAEWNNYTPLAINDLYAEEFLSDVINDAAYTRVNNMKENYNCTIKQIQILSPLASVNELGKTIMTNDSVYDIYIGRGNNFSAIVTSQYLLDFNEIPYVNLEKPWWDNNFEEQVSVLGKTFGVIGGVTSNYMKSVGAVCFNKEMIVNYSLENPYKLVQSGKWTYDRVFEMAKTVATDVGNDGMGKDDIWGINYTRDVMTPILNSSGVTIAALDNDKIPQLTINSESNVTRMINILTKLFDSQYSADTLNPTPLKAQVSDTEFFDTGNVLFIFTALHNIDAMRTTEVDFGFVPYPKYSEEENYATPLACNYMSIVTVPRTNDDLEKTGIFLEAFAYEGSKTVVNAFYEKLVLGRGPRDEESYENLKYIFSNIRYDVGAIFNFNAFTQEVNGLSKTGNLNIASFLETYRTPVQQAIDNMVKAIK